MLSGDVGTMSRLAKAIKDGGLSLPFANWGASAYDPAFISQSGGGAEGAELDAQNSLFRPHVPRSLDGGRQQSGSRETPST